MLRFTLSAVRDGLDAVLAVIQSANPSSRAQRPLRHPGAPLRHPERSEGSLFLFPRYSAKIPSVDRTSHVYMLASKSGVLYTGVTSNLNARIAQHKSARVPGFTKKYHVNRLVWLEPHSDIRAAIAREKQIKASCAPKKSP